MHKEPTYTELEQAINAYLDEVVESERTNYKSDFEPFEIFAQKLRHKLREGLHKFQKSYQRGYQVIFEELKKKLPESELVHYQSHIASMEPPQDLFSEDASLQELLGFTPDAMLVFYETAWQFIEEGRFDDAVDAFFFLVTLAPEVAEFWLDLGYAYSQVGDYMASIDAYKRALDSDPQSVDGYLACAGIFVRLQDFEQALKTCDIGLQVANQAPKEPWAKQLTALLKEARVQIESLFTKSKYGTFTS